MKKINRTILYIHLSMLYLIVLLFFSFAIIAIATPHSVIHWFLWPTYSIGLLYAFFIQINFYKRKNHLILIIFYVLTMMFFYPLEKLVEILKRNKYSKYTMIILESLYSEKVPVHAIFGTFLFFYRDHKFSDDDIDLGIFREEFDESIVKKFEKVGLVKKEEYWFDNKLMEICFIHPQKHLKIDLFLFDKAAAMAYGFDERKNRFACKEDFFSYDVKHYVFEGKAFLGPSHPEDYLNWVYGDWTKKDSNYHWFYGSSSQPNKIVENANIEKKTF